MRSSFVSFCFVFSPRSLEDESDDKANEEHFRDRVVTNKPMGLNVTTVMTYNQELPPLTRLLRRMTANFTASSSRPPSEN